MPEHGEELLPPCFAPRSFPQRIGWSVRQSNNLLVGCYYTMLYFLCCSPCWNRHSAEIFNSTLQPCSTSSGQLAATGEATPVWFAHRANMSTSSWITSMWCQFASFCHWKDGGWGLCMLDNMQNEQKTSKWGGGMEGVFSSPRKMLFRLHLSQKNASKCARALQSFCFSFCLWICWTILKINSAPFFLSFISFPSLIVHFSASLYFSPIRSKINSLWVFPHICLLFLSCFSIC